MIINLIMGIDKGSELGCRRDKTARELIANDQKKLTTSKSLENF